MIFKWMSVTLMMLGIAGISTAQAAVDSYRYAHVTISTPWYIFIFLMMGVFAPFILMAVLAWRVAIKKAENEVEDNSEKKTEK
jgi:ABC-type thiamin/hydroxymethylpyrimidine transport system permease subunit